MLIHACYKLVLPLLQASNRRNSEKVTCLIQRPEITKEQKIEALELLGAFIITECDTGIERGFKYIKNGMEERFANPSQPLLKQKMEPVKAYQNRKVSNSGGTRSYRRRCRCHCNGKSLY